MNEIKKLESLLEKQYKAVVYLTDVIKNLHEPDMATMHKGRKNILEMKQIGSLWLMKQMAKYLDGCDAWTDCDTLSTEEAFAKGYLYQPDLLKVKKT